ncbi:hypothetical protein CALCODRAFT_95492 [Calocera cornea HHB12733]|uniref:Uncharacterized protein n=1 Tax=Calocera cornea HHB12733 TaxID=1353952 RepID=A0A165IIZ1_9BASI|nr:hypothetical protein CALCODRAFT_95492 [Calocera cornea HHB12733]
MSTRSPIGKSTGASPYTLREEHFILRSLPVLSYSPSLSHLPSRSHLATPRARPSSPLAFARKAVHSTASHTSADAWQMPLHNKDRLFLVLLPSPTSPSSSDVDWALLLSPKKERKGHRESTLFRLTWDATECEKGPQLAYSAKTVDALSLPVLARWLLLKIRPGQQEFFDDEFDGVAVVQDKEWGSPGWVGSCLARLREAGLGEIMDPEGVREEVERWRVSTWERGGKAKGEVVADLRLRS